MKIQADPGECPTSVCCVTVPDLFVVLTCLFEAGNPVDIVWVKDGVHLLVAVEVLGREPHCSEGVFNYCLESG